MAELTGFEGPKCPACKSRNTYEGAGNDRLPNDSKSTDCMDCGVSTFYVKIGRKWEIDND